MKLSALAVTFIVLGMISPTTKAQSKRYVAVPTSFSEAKSTVIGHDARVTFKASFILKCNQRFKTMKVEQMVNNGFGTTFCAGAVVEEIPSHCGGPGRKETRQFTITVDRHGNDMNDLATDFKCNSVDIP
jgi:hypothetical protein